MAEKLDEMESILESLTDAVKTVKSLRDKSAELSRVTEETKKAADEIEKLEIPGEPLLDELKQKIPALHKSADSLEGFFNPFSTETASFENYLMKSLATTSISPELVKCLENLHEIAMNFSPAFSEFIQQLSNMHSLAGRITDNLTKKQKETNKAADSKRNWGAAGTAGLILAGAGIAALGIFSGGLGLAATAGIAAAASGAGVAGGVVGTLTYQGVKELRLKADDILQLANKLNLIAKNIKSIEDRAGTIKLSEQEVQALLFGLDLLKNKENLKQAEETHKQEMMRKDEEMARKDEEMARKDEEMARKDEEMARKDEEMAKQREELARQKAEMEELRAKFQNSSH